MSNAVYLKVSSWLSLVLLVAAGGCRSVGSTGLKPTLSKIPEMITLDKRRDLRPILQHFAGYFQSEIANGAARIDAESHDQEVRRATLVWRLELIPEAHNLLASDDAFAVLLDTWALCVRMWDYLRDGDGRKLFGSQQELAVETARRLRARIEEIARLYVPQGNWSNLAQRIEAYAKNNPIHGVFAYRTPARFSEAEPGSNVAELVLGAPMRAVETVGKGLDPTLRLSRSVDRFRDLMQAYPSLVRWQTQLALLHLDDVPTIQTLVRGIDNVSQSSVRLTTVAEELPERLRSESQKLLDDVDASQPELRSTLDELRQTVEAVQDALDQATQAGQAWQQTADAATQTVRQFQQSARRDRPSAAVGPASEPVSGTEATSGTNVPGTAESPFDINDYARSAEAVTATTRELRSLLQDVRDFLDEGTTEQSLKRVNDLTGTALDRTTVQLHAVIDHAAWRGAQLIALGFVLMVGYRVLVRLGPRRIAT